MNIIKNKATKALLSVSMATTLFFTANVSGSIANAKVGDINYPIPTPNFKEYSHFDELAANNKNKSSSLKGKTIILTTNDVHGAIEGYPYLAGLKKTLKDKYQANVLVVDAGDFSNDKNKPIYTTPDNCNAIDLMNKVGYDVATLGNHEFYKGYL